MRRGRERVTRRRDDIDGRDGERIGHRRHEDEENEKRAEEEEDVAAWTEHGPVPCGFC